MIEICYLDISDVDFSFDYKTLDLGARVEEKVEKLISPHKKKQSVFGWLLLKSTLKRLNLEYLYNEISVDDYGKPYFLCGDYYFNLSHSNNYCLCVVADFNIGCDIEILRDKMPKLPKKLMSEKEIEYFTNNEFSTEEKKIEKFIELWTKKESIIKLIGKGSFNLAKSICKYSLINNKSTIIYNNCDIFIKSFKINDFFISFASYIPIKDESNIKKIKKII